MKKLFALLMCATLLLGLGACSGNNDNPTTAPGTTTAFNPPATIAAQTTTEALPTPAPQETEPAQPDGEGTIELGAYRPIYYNMSASFANLVGRHAYFEWELDRVENHYEEYQNECIAVSLIKKFGVSKEDFIKANEEKRQFVKDNGDSPEDSSLYELYPVDLIYTFDNTKINEFFLWEGSIYAHENP